MNKTTLYLLAMTICMVLMSCSSPQTLNTVVPVRTQGIENFYRVMPNLYSGGQPMGDEGFASLRQLGVRTIICVDGARPNIAAAVHNGMRYVHVPVGYGGIDRDQQLEIIKAVATMPRPIYIHCHHGKHRAPAAMALVLIAVEGWSHEHAAAWMRRAGTSAGYAGLYKTVTEFDPPSRRELKRVDDQFPELVEPEMLVDAMIHIDDRWREFKKGRNAEDALLLRELFRELGRTEEVTRMPEGFAKLLADAQLASKQLETAVQSQPAQIDVAFKAVGRSCMMCHRAYRN